MSKLILTICRTLIYTFTEQDAQEVNRRRTNAESIKARLRDQVWPAGAQAHIGNPVQAGDQFPATVVKVWSENCANVRVMLDGNDDLWKTSVGVGEGNGHLAWPVNTAAPAPLQPPPVRDVATKGETASERKAREKADKAKANK